MSDSPVTPGSRPSERFTLVLAILAFPLFALGLGWSSDPSLAPYLATGSLLFLVLAARTLPRALTLVLAAILFSSVSMFFEPAGWILPALVLQAIAVAVAGAVLLLRKPGHPLLLMLLPAAGVAVFLLTRDPMQAILPLTPMLPLAVLVYDFRAKTARLTALLHLCAVLLLSLLLWGGLCVFLRQGALNPEAVASMLDPLRVSLLENLEKYLGMAFALLAEQTGAELDLSELPTVCEAILTVLINRLPGLLVFSALVLAHLLHSTLTISLYKMGREDLLYPALRHFRLSGVSALLLTFTLFVSLFTSEETLFAALCANLMLMLMPGYVLVGYQWHITHFRMMRPMQKLLNLLFWGFLLFNLPQSVLYVLAFSGITYTLHRILSARLAEHRDGDPQ